MSVGDGVIWNEALPDNNTAANQIDDYDRDLRVGVRSRMAIEHVWPDSQTGTGQAGFHRYITLQAQSAAPSLNSASGQVAALYIATSSAGYPLLFVNSAGTAMPVVYGINSITAKTAVANGDLFVIADSAASFALKSVSKSAIGSFYDRGDPSSSDWTQATMTADAGWHTLSISSIVGDTLAKAIVMNVKVNAASVTSSKYMQFRKPGNSNTINVAQCPTIYNGLTSAYDIIVPLSTSGGFEYLIAAAIDTIAITVKGWYY